MKKSFDKVLLLVLSGLFIWIMSVLFVYMVADYHHRLSTIEFSEGNFAQSYKESLRSTELNSNEPAYFVQKAKSLTGLVLSGTVSEANLKEEAFIDIQKAISLNENNLVTLRDVIPLYYFLAVYPGRNDQNSNEQYYHKVARDHYLDLVSRYPNDVGLLSQIAIYQDKLSLREDLAENLDNIRVLRPDLLEWYFPW